MVIQEMGVYFKLMLGLTLIGIRLFF